MRDCGPFAVVERRTLAKEDERVSTRLAAFASANCPLRK
jgi:hypothetical protein